MVWFYNKDDLYATVMVCAIGFNYFHFILFGFYENT